MKVGEVGLEEGEDALRVGGLGAQRCHVAREGAAQGLEEPDSVSVEWLSTSPRRARLGDQAGVSGSEQRRDQLVELALLHLSGERRGDLARLVPDSLQILLATVASDPLQPFLQLGTGESPGDAGAGPGRAHVLQRRTRLAAAVEAAEPHVALDRARPRGRLESEARKPHRIGVRWLRTRVEEEPAVDGGLRFHGRAADQHGAREVQRRDVHPAAAQQLLGRLVQVPGVETAGEAAQLAAPQGATRRVSVDGSEDLRFAREALLNVRHNSLPSGFSQLRAENRR